MVGSSLSSCLLVSLPISCAPSDRQSAEVLPLEPCEFFSCLKISGGQKFTVPSRQRSGDRGIHTFTHGDTRGQRICGDLAVLQHAFKTHFRPTADRRGYSCYCIDPLRSVYGSRAVPPLEIQFALSRCGFLTGL